MKIRSQPTIDCVQIVASIGDGLSGPSYSVPRLSEELVAQGAEVSLFTVKGWRENREWTDNRTPFIGHVALPQDFKHTPGLKKLCFSRALLDSLSQRASSADIFHTHGLWLMPNVYPAWIARKHRPAFVISPRGMLGAAAMRFSWPQKMAFWKTLQCNAVNKAGCLHATSDQEYEDIRTFGVRNPVAIIPNGIDLPQLEGNVQSSETDRVLLSLGRIHPKKGLDRLLNAWAEIEHLFPAWRLRIVGSGDFGYVNQLKKIATERRLSRVSFEEPLYDRAKFLALQSAELFVLPSLNENFGIVVAEALAAGTAVVATKGTPWQELTSRRCGWWVDAEATALAAALVTSMAIPQRELKEMGLRGRGWMEQEFSWDRVAADMLDVYRWLAGSDGMPATVRLQ
jgi:glycosyltransferase involved in cell wall biosynthesis